MLACQARCVDWYFNGLLGIEVDDALEISEQTEI
jgi:hypothetical protein